VVRFPDLDGAITGAAERSAALDEAADCLGSWLSAAILRKGAIPVPSMLKRGQVAVAGTPVGGPEGGPYTAKCRRKKISNSELARPARAWRETVVRRMLEPGSRQRNSMKIEAALRAVGKSAVRGN